MDDDFDFDVPEIDLDWIPEVDLGETPEIDLGEIQIDPEPVEIPPVDIDFDAPDPSR